MNGFKGYQIYWNTEGSLRRYLDTYIIEKAIIFISRMNDLFLPWKSSNTNSNEYHTYAALNYLNPSTNTNRTKIQF